MITTEDRLTIDNCIRAARDYLERIGPLAKEEALRYALETPRIEAIGTRLPSGELRIDSLEFSPFQPSSEFLKKCDRILSDVCLQYGIPKPESPE